MSNTRLVVTIAGALAVLAAAGVLVWSAVATSSAQINASTSSSGLFSAGTVELDQAGDSVGLLFDADGLVPGRVVAGCVAIEYGGSLPAAVRLHASRAGGTGLEEHIEFRVWQLSSGSCPTETPAEPARFAGLLGELWRSHPDYDRGLGLTEASRSGDVVLLLAEAEVVGGDEAQGLTTEFTVVVEARP